MKGQKITAEDMKRLRVQTAMGLMDCKKALNATENDEEAAIKWLRDNIPSAPRLINVR